ncbi:MAG TPA: heavy metal-associated domain-containing protein [Aequorivita sp.]|nr:heavy metal-associated domain-containing protein [Aequorivita sp.]|tara:strand:+ start:5214 stop:5480 length:267 start_codon:yes stop_codon:yes gene_type:complete
MYKLATPEKVSSNSENPEVLIFGSNIDTQLKESVVKLLLQNLPGIIDISVDRENWERILRVECNPQVPSDLVVAKVRSMGFKCYELVG